MKRRGQPLLHPYPKIDPATGKRWSLADQGNAALNEVCNALNSKVNPDLKMWLRSWVSAWQASGPNLKKLYGSLPEPQRTALLIAMGTLWIPTDGAIAELFFVPDYPALERLLGKQRVWLNGQGGKRRLTPETESLCLFHLLTIIPRCDCIAGPCPRCNRYYIKKRTTQTIYCSRRCGNAMTAVARTRERIASERADKLARAQAAIKKWKPTDKREDWKHWVAEKTEIDLRFLTRAVNKGDLMPPK